VQRHSCLEDTAIHPGLCCVQATAMTSSRRASTHAQSRRALGSARSTTSGTGATAPQPASAATVRLFLMLTMHTRRSNGTTRRWFLVILPGIRARFLPLQLHDCFSSSDVLAAVNLAAVRPDAAGDAPSSDAGALVADSSAQDAPADSPTSGAQAAQSAATAGSMAAGAHQAAQEPPAAPVTKPFAKATDAPTAAPTLAPTHAPTAAPTKVATVSSRHGAKQHMPVVYFLLVKGILAAAGGETW
jgi:hypothetical protein